MEAIFVIVHMVDIVFIPVLLRYEHIGRLLQRLSVFVVNWQLGNYLRSYLIAITRTSIVDSHFGCPPKKDDRSTTTD